MGHYRKVVYLTKQAYKNLISRCHEGFNAAKKQMLISQLKMAKKYLKSLVFTRRAYRIFVRNCRAGKIAAKLKIARTYQRACFTIQQGCKNFVRGLVALGVKIARQYRKVRLGTKLAYRKLVEQCLERLSAAKHRTRILWRKIARKNLRLLVHARRSYRNIVKQGLAAAKQKVFTLRLKTARFHLRILVKIRRAYRDIYGGLSAAGKRILGLWKRLWRQYLRSVVVIRRSYRSLVSQYRKARVAARRSVDESWKNVLATAEKVDRSSEIIEEKHLRTTGQFRKQILSSFKRVAGLCLSGLSGFGQSVASSIADWKVRLKPRKKLVRASATAMYLHKHVENEISEELATLAAQKKSFFSKLTKKLPTRGYFKNLRVYILKQWVSLILIGFVSFYFLFITYIVSYRYKDFESPNIALGEANPRKATGKSINNPPLALIAYSVDEKKNRKGVASKNPSGYSFWPKRITLRHVEGWGEGVSFGTDYSTLALLSAPDYRSGPCYADVGPSRSPFRQQHLCGKYRYWGQIHSNWGWFCQILGLNAFYDWREGKLGNYQQIGVGLEILGKRWDLRANGYVPISVKQRKLKCVFNQYEGDYFAIHRQCEFTSYGYNAEVGYYAIRGKDFFLYAAGGPYYLVRKCHNKTRGGEFRLRPQYKDYLALDFSVSHDNVFGTVYQAQVILYLPLYQISKRINKRPCGLSDQQIYQPIERFEVMPIGRRSCWQTNF